MKLGSIGFIGLAITAPAAAQTAEEAAPSRGAIGSDLFHSTDADNTDVVRLGFDLDWLHANPEKYRGVRVEKAWFNPAGEGWKDRTRVYGRFADSVSGWKWNARLGTDGRAALGAATIHDESEFRKEFFVEREVVETPEGLRRGIYYTFVGAAVDLPVDERNVFTAMTGVQSFTGDNVRTHLRANYIHVLNPEMGLSAQLRTRYFRNSDPREFDYYSPRWYAQALPLLQLRRSTEYGWRYLLAGGVGVQRDAGSKWRRSSYLNARLTSPLRSNWAFETSVLYSETPSAVGNSYRYGQLSLGLRRKL